MRTTIGALMRRRIYAMLYGEEGTGKTSLIMTLSQKPKGQPLAGTDIGFVTADEGGPTSVVELGWSKKIPVEILPGRGKDPFLPAVRAIESFARDKTINAICVDGCTVIAWNAVDYISKGAGAKAMGFEGWDKVYLGFRRIEAACEYAVRAGKSVTYTAWEDPPEYVETMGGQDISKKGRPSMPGKGKVWLPGKCDGIYRVTSRFRKAAGAGGKVVSQFEGSLQIRASEEYLAKTRWNIPDPVPFDLAKILDIVAARSAPKVAKTAK